MRTKLLGAVGLASIFGVCGLAVFGEAPRAGAAAGCSAAGERVVAQRWDAVLGKGWELVGNCAHPEWPARLLASNSVHGTEIMSRVGLEPVTEMRPLLVHAGDVVLLWRQGATVRIEMEGVAEQAARGGERVVVRVSRRTDDAGLTVERIDGTVRGARNVEMER